MAIFMVQTQYQMTKTFYVDAEDEEAAQEFFDEGGLDEVDPALFREDSELRAFTRIEGKINPTLAEHVIEVPLRPLVEGSGH